MNIKGKTTTINLDELISFSRGDKKIIQKYLTQFSKLIPGRIESLNEQLQTQDRKKLRQLLHQMSPQLQFFGIKDLVQPIRRLEHEYQTMPYGELYDLVEKILVKLNLALIDIDLILKENF